MKNGNLECKLRRLENLWTYKTDPFGNLNFSIQMTSAFYMCL